MIRIALLATIAVVASAELANAQVMARRFTGRVMQSVGMPNWLIRNQLLQPNVIVVPPTVTNPPTGSGQPVTGSAAVESQATVEIKIMLPSNAVGANIKINGVDFGKTEFFERKITVPEAPGDNKHDYVVEAQWQHNGKDVKHTRTVTVGKRGKATANFIAPAN